MLTSFVATKFCKE